MAKKGAGATEHQIQHACNDLLRYSGWYVMRTNAGRIPLAGEGGTRRLILLNDAGTPDTLAFRAHPRTPHTLQLLFIEYKRPGKKPTALQSAKMDELRRYGATCVVVTSVEELQEVLKQLEQEAA